MGCPIIYPNSENGSIKELKGVSSVGSNETTSRSTAIQFLLSGVPRENGTLSK